MSQEERFFEFAAQVGLTKHIGGIEATDEMAGLCHIDADSYVLDVGCGVGQTPCYLANKYKCKVVGVDIVEKMVERSQQRAKREQVTDIVEFKVADAQDLPFEDGLFDVVMTESVTAFPEDKQKAVMEYVRVTKPGGYVGLNESIWLKTPPPPDVVAWVRQDLGSSAEPLSPAAWRALLIDAGLIISEVGIKLINTQDEVKGIIRRYNLIGIIAMLFRTLALYIHNPHYRKFVKEVSQGGVFPDNLDEYFGYGIFVGRKPNG